MRFRRRVWWRCCEETYINVKAAGETGFHNIFTIAEKKKVQRLRRVYGKNSLIIVDDRWDFSSNFKAGFHIIALFSAIVITLFTPERPVQIHVPGTAGDVISSDYHIQLWHLPCEEVLVCSFWPDSSKAGGSLINCKTDVFALDIYRHP